MSDRIIVKNFRGHAAVFAGVVSAFGERVIAVVEREIRFLSSDEWNRLPPWHGHAPFNTPRL